MPDGEVDYGYLLDDDEAPRPDPRSRRQPDGVHERSRTVDAGAFAWTDDAWTGRQLAGAVVYELHVGTFTPEGTLDAALGRLDHLARHRRRPGRADAGERLQRHPQLGLRRGRAGSRSTRRTAARRRTSASSTAATPPGSASSRTSSTTTSVRPGTTCRCSGPTSSRGRQHLGRPGQPRREGSRAEVRRYIIDNALMWLRDFHVDGLRLDAVHALVDASRDAPARGAGHRGRRALGVRRPAADPDRRVRPERPGAGHSARGGRLRAGRAVERRLPPRAARRADRRDRAATTPTSSRSRALAKVCERGFFHDGTCSSFRERDHGVPIDTAAMPTWRLVVCHQNHDQVGNRARGDRTTEVLDVDQLACAALLTLAGPFTPMLFRARSGPPRRRSSSSPRTRSPSSGGRPPRGGSASSRGWAGTRTRSPTRRSRRRSPAPSWTGRSAPRAGTRSCSRPTAASPSCAAPSPP